MTGSWRASDDGTALRMQIFLGGVAAAGETCRSMRLVPDTISKGNGVGHRFSEGPHRIGRTPVSDTIFRKMVSDT
ncbi:hypothetical protein [Pseudoduganella albidiflava]|uniref:Uncharacterized protein n=1 Tax=Pseudoduganella albidiflava TaxID=321983 RepID=A0ABX5RRC5_9BURK|nr:hypothetical protein [Pseudoduganella albidiflava]QBI01170.1 hypothetical protein EYF70_10180 [Pseudoduganella albidiflava]